MSAKFQNRNDTKLRGLVLTLYFRRSVEELERHFRSIVESRGVRLSQRHDGSFDVADGENASAVTLIVGLSEGKGNGASATARIDHRFEVDESAVDGCSYLTLSPDLAGDGGDPVEQLVAMTTLALDLLDDDAAAVHWDGARSLMGADYFTRMAAIWIDGGAFPALGLAALVKDAAGAVRSVGLDVLVGQDVAVLPGPGLTPADQARLAIRVMDFLVREGPVHHDQAVEVEGFGAVNFEIDENKGLVNLYR